MKTLIFDIEADGFLYDATRVWCLVGYCPEEDRYHIYLDNQVGLCYPKNTIVYSNIDYISKYNLVGHNIINYDLPLLSKLFNYKYNLSNVEDTVVMSRLFYPDREAHSLEWWGKKFKLYKGDHKDFSKLSQEMLDYCIQDVRITYRTWLHLKEEARDWDWSEALKIEQAMAHIQTKQEQNGVLMDIDLAKSIVYNVSKEIKEIEEQVVPAIPMKCKHTGDINKPFKKDGSYSEQAKKWMESLEDHSVG